MKYTDVAWDFDGCLYDSYPQINADMQIILARHGVEASVEEINSYTRVTQGHAIAHYAPLCGLSPEEFGEEYRGYKDSYLSDLCRPYPGIPELLRDIAAAGMKNHICSNRVTEQSRVYLERDGLLPYFGAITGPDKEKGIARKPAPDMVAAVVAQRGISPEKLLMVGDRELDILAAHGAGSHGCFFDPDGCNPQPACVEYIAPDVATLRKIIFGE